ncbi:MAG: 3-hydroxyacyl-[acyl-carrier-protein] dehydratase FabZ [Desulfovibrio sp.]|nr:MAG: 3-hydroxyacyl-[acyl-carrier-protein] dehydratase FabZ [Desulfovibrio sp.]
MAEDSIKTVEILEIFQQLPHRYPFLMVDKVLDWEASTFITALKNVTINEPFFQGHFPGLPVMPGVLVLEALAQAGGILISKSAPDFAQGKLFMFTSMEKVKFRRPVRPGDQLLLKCFDIRHKLQLVKMNCQALVNDEIAVEASMGAAVVAKEDIT